MKSAICNRQYAILLAALLLTGCKDTPGFYPNAEPALRNSVGSYRTDAAQRIYPTEAPRGSNLVARAQIGYVVKAVDVANLSTADWDNVEVWVNKQYVCFLPKMQAGRLKSIPFDALFDRNGQHIPRDSRTFVVEDRKSVV